MRKVILTMLRASYGFGVSKPRNEPGHINVAKAIDRSDGEGCAASDG